MGKETQSKIESRIEVACNYISGFLIAWLTWHLIVWGPFAWGWLTIDDGFEITMIFTVVSIVRSYFWRRFFARQFHLIIHDFVQRVIA